MAEGEKGKRMVTALLYVSEATALICVFIVANGNWPLIAYAVLSCTVELHVQLLPLNLMEIQILRRYKHAHKRSLNLLECLHRILLVAFVHI